MGHTTRCLAIAQQLIANGVTVIVATPETQRSFWEKNLPEIKLETILGYHVTYGNTFPAWVSVLTQSPRLLGTIKKEESVAKELALKYKVDSIISDNRFGFYAEGICTNIYLTNQLFQQIGKVSKLADVIHHNYIKQFDYCVVPDYANIIDSLAGSLTHGDTSHLPPVHFINPLSRLQPLPLSKRFDTVLVSSGPLPLRLDFTKQLMLFALEHPEKQFALIAPERGTVEAANVTQFIQESVQTLSAVFSQTNHLMCRSGYSTLMDAHVCGIKKFTLIPTKGQPEQIYLAQYWREKFKAEVLNSDFLS